MKELCEQIVDMDDEEDPEAETGGAVDAFDSGESFEAETYIYNRATLALGRKLQQYVEERNIVKLDEYWQEFARNLDQSSLRLPTSLRESFEYDLEEMHDLLGPRIYLDDGRSPATAQSKSLVLQASEELVRRAALNPSILREISPRQFEELMAEIFAHLGYEVELTAPSKDGGVDLVAVRSLDGIPLKLLVECKRYVPPNRVGVGRVRELWGVKTSSSASQAVLATTSYFSRDAIDFQRSHLYELELKDFDAVAEWVRLLGGREA